MRPLALALALAFALAAADKCPQYQSCSDCLNPKDPALDCGWCSPDAAIFADGTKATQCMDHTSKGWACFHLYMHDGCIAGYVCDHEDGQCKLGPPGTGDTKENCQIKCHPPAPPPPPQYACNITTFTCEVAPEGKTSKDGCSSACSNSTPAELVGLWRSLDVQLHFALGEYLMNFTERSVAWGPLASPRMYEAQVATLSRTTLRLTLTAPAADAGAVLFASYSTPGWPTGPETGATAVALQRSASSHRAPPEDVSNAMGDADFDVYVMHKCNDWKAGKCSFAPAFASPKKSASGLAASLASFEALLLEKPSQPHLGGMADDKCTVHADCDSCINDPLKVCGWCDGVITFGDKSTCGADGKGCCGGASGFSKCDLAYRKECPVVCDWTNWTNPSCRAATSTEIKNKVQTFPDCETIAPWCKYTFGHFCNRTDPVAPQCVEVTKEQCERTPGCDVNNPNCGNNCTAPTPPPPTQLFYCDEAGGGCKGPFTNKTCAADPMCSKKNTTSCDPTKCSATVSYVCDKDSFKCTQVAGKPPAHSFNTSKACEETCYDNDVAGVWRGIRIDNGFVVDEWDFKFSELAGGTVTYKSKKTGTIFSGTYEIGDPASDQQFSSYTLTIKLSTGETLVGLYDNQDQGPITKFMYLGMPLADGDVAKSYDDAMDVKKQEFVLVACLPQVAGCDFSPASPK
ncbi:hypothetical protein AB1Y20_002485 [Prymnesium parvum]|uniref:Uncharacterized protein n=1 Tax=Prymnesium parvum TaxID=97485 RepID=A0AB34JAR8_PRYPA